ncbi:MAG: hypothetical protein II921_06830 [Treponema sp.]|nr:hypothetical protein [Treponema sp.]
MDDSIKYVLEGRKTFFIVPDVSLLPEAYLEDYMNRGYEAYIVNDDKYCPLRTKVDIIIETFKDSILFFYVDSVVEGIEWRKYILELQRKYGDSILIGVLHSPCETEEERIEMEKFYVFDVGIQCGCITLEYQKNKNYPLIDRVLYATQACGRRKSVRAICDSASRVTFTLNDANALKNADRFVKNMMFKGKILDVSISHFSCTFDRMLDLKIGAKIPDVLVNINGMHFTSDTILLMQREIPSGMLFVFGFLDKNGKKGLDPDNESRLLEKIYVMVSDRVKALMWEKFDEARKKAQANKNRFVASQVK